MNIIITVHVYCLVRGALRTASDRFSRVFMNMFIVVNKAYYVFAYVFVCVLSSIYRCTYYLFVCLIFLPVIGEQTCLVEL